MAESEFVLIAAAVLPALWLLFRIYQADKLEKEPIGLIVKLVGFGVLSTVLASYRIPCYIARKMPAAAHGACRFLLSSLRAIAEGYPAEEMLSVIKSGYAPVSEEEAWRMENYIQSYGIRGKLWLEPFKRGTPEECAALENARQSLITPLHAMREAMKAAQDSAQALQAVYAYLEAAEVYARLLENQEELTNRNMPAEAMQIQQLWEAVMQLLSQAEALLGAVRVSPRQLASWLEAGLDASRFSPRRFMTMSTGSSPSA